LFYWYIEFCVVFILTAVRREVLASSLYREGREEKRVRGMSSTVEQKFQLGISGSGIIGNLYIAGHVFQPTTFFFESLGIFSQPAPLSK